jgi:hypothetical protein
LLRRPKSEQYWDEYQELGIPNIRGHKNLRTIKTEKKGKGYYLM